MRKAPLLPVLLLTLAALGWGGYWFVGSIGTQKALAGWLEDRRAEGWIAEAKTIDTRGFPNRFDTTFEGLTLRDPDTGVGWSAGLVQTLSLAYRPTHIIAILPGEQVFETPGQRLSVSADSLRGSFQVRPELTFPITTSTFELDTAGIVSSQGWIATLAAAQFSMRETPGAADGAQDGVVEGVPEANTYDLYFTGAKLDPGEGFLPVVRETAGLPRVIEAISARMTTRFDAPWDRYAIERGRPQPREVRIDALSVTWGEMAVSVTGDLEIDREGVAHGTLDISVKNWRAMLAVAQASGAITPLVADVLRSTLGYLAGRSGDPDTLDDRLIVADGQMQIAGFPIGPAPRITLP